MEKWEQRARKVEKRKSAMVMTGKGTIRQQNELREKARQAARASERRASYTAKAFGEVAE
jgi:hypothetical protein